MHPSGQMWMDPYGRPIYAPRARVLAECEAKRRIVGLAAEQPQVFAEAAATLAEVYADHPDYRDEWRP